jgi:hypothetical protein
MHVGHAMHVTQTVARSCRLTRSCVLCRVMCASLASITLRLYLQVAASERLHASTRRSSWPRACLHPNVARLELIRASRVHSSPHEMRKARALLRAAAHCSKSLHSAVTAKLACLRVACPKTSRASNLKDADATDEACTRRCSRGKQRKQKRASLLMEQEAMREAEREAMREAERSSLPP